MNRRYAEPQVLEQTVAPVVPLLLSALVQTAMLNHVKSEHMVNQVLHKTMKLIILFIRLFSFGLNFYGNILSFYFLFLI